MHRGRESRTFDCVPRKGRTGRHQSETCMADMEIPHQPDFIFPDGLNWTGLGACVVAILDRRINEGM